MATPQLSPGILVREIDLTVGRVDNVINQIGGIAGPFQLGPVDEPIKEQEEWGRTHRPSMLCPSLKLEMASGVKTIRML